MDRLSVEIVGEFSPEMVVVVYKHNHEFYLESHKLLDGGVLGPGKPLSIATVKAIADNFTSKKLKTLEKKMTFLKGYVPPNIVYYDQDQFRNHIAWYMPSQEVDLYFDKGLKLKDGRAVVPNMLFVKGQGFHVFALEHASAKLSTKIFEAPFPNISDNGGVCLGSVKQKDSMSTYTEAMRSYEGLFFNSRFTSDGLDRRIANISMIELWKESMKTKQSFNNDYLVPHKKYKTFKDIIENIYSKEALY